MKRAIYLLIIFSLAFSGRLGIGISGGSEYFDYETITIEQIPGLYYGGEFSLQAEALPNLYLEPMVSYLNNPALSSSALGFGLRANVQPRLGRFPIAPFFGVEGALLLYNNNLNASTALMSDRLETYIETSQPRTIGLGFAGVTIFLGKSVSIDCQYRYLSIADNYGIEMAWLGLTYYINW